MIEPEEYFDVVDDQDQVIDCRTRVEVHQNNLFHRAVHAIVMNDRQDVFLQLRGPHRDNNPNLWDSSVGGHLKTGENYDQAIIRETAEEIGIKLKKPPEKLFKLTASATTDYEFCWVYKIIHNGPLTIDRHEAVEGRWFESTVLDEWIMKSPRKLTRAFRLIWQTYKEQYKINE